MQCVTGQIPITDYQSRPDINTIPIVGPVKIFV